MRLAAARIALTTGASDALGLQSFSSVTQLTDDDVDAVWLRFIKIQSNWRGQGRLERTVHHVFAQTFDASHEYNPRIVLGYLSFLVREQAALCQIEDPPLPMEQPLIGQPATSRALADLSNWRMESYLYAEFQHLKVHFQRLKGQCNSFAGADALRHALGLTPSRESDEIISELRYCGLIEYDASKELFSIAKLYKASLQSKACTKQAPEPEHQLNAPRSASLRPASAARDDAVGPANQEVGGSPSWPADQPGPPSGGATAPRAVTPADVARMFRRRQP
jgi:hypothetical protein